MRESCKKKVKLWFYIINFMILDMKKRKGMKRIMSLLLVLGLAVLFTTERCHGNPPPPRQEQQQMDVELQERGVLYTFARGMVDGALYVVGGVGVAVAMGILLAPDVENRIREEAPSFIWRQVREQAWSQLRRFMSFLHFRRGIR
jgi:hypothetical protein